MTETVLKRMWMPALLGMMGRLALPSHFRRRPSLRSILKWFL